MGMPSHPRSKALIIWIVLISILYLIASCGNDQDKTDKTADVTEKVPKIPQVIVKEWYPRSKYPPPSAAYVPAPGPSAPSAGQPQSSYTGIYQPPQMTEQMSPQSSPWNQSGQSQGMPQQYQTQQRPWGEFPPLEKKKKSTTRQEQRPVTIPYGGWPGYGGYGGYGGYSYGLSDPSVGAPGWGGGIYNPYPELIPPVYGW
jgi:hypothetical protein